MNAPLCFVLMPFGKKPDSAGLIVDFDAVYNDLIAPAIRQAQLEPLRADEEMSGGIIHKPMFDRLILCDFAVADLTTANANVFYELGVRHAVRPGSTVLMFAEGGRLPFDVALLRALPYQLTPEGTPAAASQVQDALGKRLIEAREAASQQPAPDSPVFQLVEGFPDISRIKTDAFRERIEYAEQIKQKLADARKLGVEAVRAIHEEMRPIRDQESGIVMDLFLSYRAVKAWVEMIGLCDKMARPVAASVMVQEQLALALNRVGQGERAEQVLRDLLDRRGPSSETYGILGRVYKDRWEAAVKSGDLFLARGLLDKAIEAYLRGFESDSRDSYPGINAVTLMELREPPDPRRHEVLPVVAYAVERRMVAGKPDYWDFATRLELAVLAKDKERAMDALSQALAAIREVWEPETTARNLRLIREAREKRQEDVSWSTQIETELNRKATT